MLIPNTLFSFILNINTLESFPVLNKLSISRKRFYASERGIANRKNRSERLKKQWENYTDKEREDFSKKMRKTTSKYFSKDPRAEQHREKLSCSQSAAMKKYHKEMSPEEREKHFNRMREAHKKADHGRYHRGFDAEIIEKEQINDYSGIITESQMQELLNET